MTAEDAPLSVVISPRMARVTALLVAVSMIGLGVWYVNSPTALPTESASIQASTPNGVPVYVGVFAPNAQFSRTLHLSDIQIRATNNPEAMVTPLLCRRGTIGVTSDPAPFCAEVIDPEGRTFGPGDALILEVTSDEPAVVAIDRVRVGFREGIQRGTREAGAPAVVRVLAH